MKVLGVGVGPILRTVLWQNGAVVRSLGVPGAQLVKYGNLYGVGG